MSVSGQSFEFEIGEFEFGEFEFGLLSLSVVPPFNTRNHWNSLCSASWELFSIVLSPRWSGLVLVSLYFIFEFEFGGFEFEFGGFQFEFEFGRSAG